MKEYELSINDWITYHEYPYQLICIMGYGSNVYLKYNQLVNKEELDNVNGCVCIEDIKPILLTKEILKANGFSDGCYMYKELDENTTIEVCLDKGIPMYINHRDRYNYCFPHPEYVHELQHILRMNGLNDIANNFEINTK